MTRTSSRRMVRLARVSALLVGCVVVTTVLMPSRGSTSEPPSAPTIVGQHWVTGRTLHVDIATSAFTEPAPVEITFPEGYTSQPDRRWPVTYYLHGANHDQTTFRAEYDGETVTRDYESIVVSPRGVVGFWSDWFNTGQGGPPRYETFVVDELIPLVDATYRTIGDRAHRAVMGESMGGFGTLSLAARHPDLFVAAASLSGAVDSNLPAAQPVIALAPALQGGQLNAIFGPRSTQEVVWRGHNPWDLADNLRDVDLQLFTGTGTYDPAHGETLAEALGGCGLEGGLIRPMSTSLHERLTTVGISHRWVALAWGCHGAALFEHEMGLAIARFSRVFGATPPSTFEYRSTEADVRVWGWDVRTDSTRATEFLQLRDVSHGGLTLSGSGTTTVRTPAFFTGRSSVAVTIDGQRAQVAPDDAGHLTFAVPLGRANQQQQYRVGSSTPVTTAVVTFD